MDQDEAAPLEEATPGYFLLGASLGAGITLGNQKIDVYLGASNLLNKSYLDHLSLYRPSGIRQMGRNISLHLKLSF